ncbi:MAG: hypothetical protein KJ779_01445 [Firmicutes bacterium]|nr:hypothetical protein [Bacillota bacterium]
MQNIFHNLTKQCINLTMKTIPQRGGSFEKADSKKRTEFTIVQPCDKRLSFTQKRLEKHTTIDEQILKKEKTTIEEYNIYRMRNDIVTQAKNEWEIDTSRSVDILSDDKKVRCEVRGMPIKNVFYIKNSINQNSLRTGSECIKHFAITDKQNLDSLLKDARRLKRREAIENIFPGINLRIFQWKNFIEDQPIIINDSLAKQYYALGDSLSSVYGLYLKHENSSDKESEDEIRGILNETDKLISEI